MKEGGFVGHTRRYLYCVRVGDRNKAILFYDGDCILCNRSIRFLMKCDHKKFLFYAPIQGRTANEYLSIEQRKNISSAIYHRPLPDGQSESRLRSEAVLYAILDINGSWRWLARALLWIPRSLANAFYDWIAAHRHHFFKSHHCELIQLNEKSQILP